MIQRIQTVFLFIALAIGISIFFLPLGVFNSNDFHFSMKVTGITFLENSAQNIQVNSIPLIITLILNVLLSGITIFLFKKRQLQLRFVKINIIINTLFVLLVFLFSDKITLQIASPEPAVYGIGAYFSLLIIIFQILAAHRINKDEKLVRSADRLR